MIAKSGVKVLDFGLAAREGDQTLAGERGGIGTPAYMAPEQREGKGTDARTDIYAFGLLLYEMLTGERLVPQRRRLRGRRLEAMVSRCLENDRARRWQSAAELQSELAAVPRVSRREFAVADKSPMRPPILIRKDKIVLGEFENKTRNCRTGEILAQHQAQAGRKEEVLNALTQIAIQIRVRLVSRWR